MSSQEIWQGDARKLVHMVPDGINCILTDPPFGVDFVSRRAITPQGKRWVAPVVGDSSLEEAGNLFLEVVKPLVAKTAEEAEMYVFTRWDIVDVWINLVRQLTPFQYKMMVIWDKGYPGQGDIDSNWGCGHEIILYAKKGRRDVPYRRSSIIAVDKVHASQIIHPTEKPVGLIEKLLEMSTNRGDLVVDPFSGSGSTVVAAQKMSRSAIGIELETRYVLAAEKRLSQPVMEF